jgi:hydroxymethylglutaryl-CoA lyase
LELIYTTPDKWFEKIDAAYHAVAEDLMGYSGGFGGCPMARMI